MKNQVKCYNEVILVGRIVTRQRNVKCNNQKAIRVTLAIPNDDNYEAGPIIACFYVYDDGQIYELLKRKQAIVIHVNCVCNYGQRIIADLISIIVELYFK